jgi:hypothetical protein
MGWFDSGSHVYRYDEKYVGVINKIVTWIFRLRFLGEMTPRGSGVHLGSELVVVQFCTNKSQHESDSILFF